MSTLGRILDVVPVHQKEEPWWIGWTPAQKFAHVEELRRMNYGDAASGRLQPKLRNRTGRIASQPAQHLGSYSLLTAPDKGAPRRLPSQSAARSGRATSLSIASFRFKEFLRLFRAHGVRHLLVGGWAVSLHGRPRATQDLDDLENLPEF